MSLLDDLKGKIIEFAGVAYPDRKRLNFVANGAVVTDEPANNRTTINFDALLNDIVGFRPESYGAVGDGVTDDAAAIQAAIDAAYAAGGGRVVFQAGTYVIGTTIELKSGVHMDGAGLGTTILTQHNGANIDLVTTEDFSGGLVDCAYFGITGITLDGNYLESAWNASSNTINNSTGYGLKIRGYAFKIDVSVKNVPEVGILLEDLSATPETTRQTAWNLRAKILDTGQEGIVVRGYNDGVIEELFAGRCGIAPRPTAQTAFATSSLYPADPVDGLVLDGVNVEVKFAHVYACWSGCGVRTRGAVRLEASHIVSESNRAGLQLDSGAYGSISWLSIRNNGLYHPNWTAVAPTYSADSNGLDDTWDGVTVSADDFTIHKCQVFRTVTASTQVRGWCGIAILGDGNHIEYTHRNSTDPDSGALYTGRGITVVGDYNMVSSKLSQVNGDGVVLSGKSNTITFNDSDGINGYGLVRDGGASNENWGNSIRGAVNATDSTRGGFNSTQGTPNGEIVDLTITLHTSATAFTGTSFSNARSQRWALCGILGATRYELYTNPKLFNGGVQVYQLTGSPEGSLTAPVGSLCLRTGGGAGTTLYVKESGTGNTGWVAK